MFTCHLTSPAFPNRERTCRIGPVSLENKVQGNNNNNNNNNNDNIKNNKDESVGDDSGHIINQDIQVSSECNRGCTSEDEQLVLYLTLSTFGASILCILFLTTTVTFCYKYHTITTDGIDERRTVPPDNDGSDPVYVSMQRRSEYDRNSVCSTYMTLEDPNNPGGKVLMPKEVFDEFYRTLTVKRV